MGEEGVGHSTLGKPTDPKETEKKGTSKDISVPGQHNLPSHFTEEQRLVVLIMGKKVL